MKWQTLIIMVAAVLAACCTAPLRQRSALIEIASPRTRNDAPTEYALQIVRIVNTTDFQWSRIDTVLRVYEELTHTTCLMCDGTAKQWRAPFVVTILEGGSR